MSVTLPTRPPRHTLGYVDWFNHVRIHEDLGHRTSAEVEAEYYQSITDPDEQPLPGQLTVHKTGTIHPWLARTTTGLRSLR